MKTVQAILFFGGIALFTSLALSGTAHACGGDKDNQAKVESSDTRSPQSVSTTEPKQMAVNQNEVYGPPAPENTIGAGVTLSQSGSR